MTYDWQIEPGDEVKVFPIADDNVFYRGIVKHTPQQTGEAWIIDATGVITYQQTYNRIVRTGKREHIERLKRSLAEREGKE